MSEPYTWEDLKTPFADKDLEWRIQRAGNASGKPWAIIVPYIQSRAVMDRLDEVVGPGNWQDEYTPVNGGFLCSLRIRVGDEWVAKVDGAGETNIESLKGGISDALKRVAVKWGIGRYLYHMGEVRFFGDQINDGYAKGADKDRAVQFKIDDRPCWVMPPSGEVHKPEAPPDHTDETLGKLRDDLMDEIKTIMSDNIFSADDRMKKHAQVAAIPIDDPAVVRRLAAVKKSCVKERQKRLAARGAAAENAAEKTLDEGRDADIPMTPAGPDGETAVKVEEQAEIF